MPFCGECGKQYKDGLKFCPHCGTPNELFKAESIKQKAESSTESTFRMDTVLPNGAEEYKTRIRGASSYGVLNLEDLPAGHVIDERYEIKEKVGQGGFGAVYRVFDRTMEIDKALKVIPQAVVSDAEALYDLQQEAKTMIALNHPNIVRVFDFHNTGSIKYIDMEYVPGKTLTQLKLECPNKQMPEAQVKEYAIKIALGMAYAHQHNVLHKDIKPQNIKVTPEGAIKIMDFGIAETVRTSMSRIQNTSSSGTLVYMSPEQIKGRDVGKESDIYSFGAMLYELLSGHPPFYKGDISYQILNEKPVAIEHVSEETWHFVTTCLAKNYVERYRTFDEVLRELTGTVSYVPIPPKKPVVQPIQPEETEIQEPESIPGMVFVKGGTFQMGSNDGYIGAEPVHSVTVDDFYMGKYPVTQEEWKAVMGNNPSYFKGENLPIERVSWYDAVEFCNKKSELEGLQKCYNGRGNNITCDFSKNGYRLPTEAEWEYAARGGNLANGLDLRNGGKTYYKYSGSNTIDVVAWYCDNSDYKTYPVGRKQANELGIYDMSGNVREWCWDWFGFYSNSLQTNPKGASTGPARVLRGGSWYSVESISRVAYRDNDGPDFRCFGVGFRLACSVK
jgi:serine/threonine protein kinase